MKYETTRKEFYEGEINRIAEQAAEILDKGCSVEFARSRSGLKMFSVRRRHEVFRGNGKDGGQRE